VAGGETVHRQGQHRRVSGGAIDLWRRLALARRRAKWREPVKRLRGSRAQPERGGAGDTMAVRESTRCRVPKRRREWGGCRLEWRAMDVFPVAHGARAEHLGWKDRCRITAECRCNVLKQLHERGDWRLEGTPWTTSPLRKVRERTTPARTTGARTLRRPLSRPESVPRAGQPPTRKLRHVRLLRFAWCATFRPGLVDRRGIIA